MPALFRFQGIVYRAHDPKWAFDPASGHGAALYGGRFNKPGTPMLYTATSIMGAITEAAQGMVMRLQPLTIVSVRSIMPRCWIERAASKVLRFCASAQGTTTASFFTSGGLLAVGMPAIDPKRTLASNLRSRPSNHCWYRTTFEVQLHNGSKTGATMRWHQQPNERGR